MTDVELPQMAGSGDSDPGAEHRPVENSEINSNKETSGRGSQGRTQEAYMTSRAERHRRDLGEDPQRVTGESKGEERRERKDQRNNRAGRQETP